MVKHNNVVPNLHFHKKYCQSSRGPLKVKLALNQATRKKARRVKRAAKAAAIAPRPMKKLRPLVQCPTQRYSSKTRQGRGFSLAELKAAKLHPSYALTVGISIDLRRVNKSEEVFERNVARLEEYKKDLVVWTKKSTPSEIPAQITGIIKPAGITKPAIRMEEVTDEMKEFKAFTTMRLARQETKIAGQRVAVQNRKSKK